jgi:hypothetical protein
LTGLDVPGNAGVPLGLQSGPEVQVPLEPCVCVCPGETGAPPVVELEVDGVAWVTDVVVVAVVAGFVAVDVAAPPVVVDWVEDDDLLC